MSKNYEDILSSFSERILCLDSVTVSSSLENKTIKNFSIYTNNYLYMAIDRLSVDYAGTIKYLGKNNFSFFVRKMLLETGIKSPSFEVFSKSFSSYLEDQKEVHKDEILVAVSRIDKLWSFEDEGFIITFEGMLLFWKELLDETQSDNKIDLSRIEKIGIVSINGDSFLKVLETFDV